MPGLALVVTSSLPAAPVKKEQPKPGPGQAGEKATGLRPGEVLVEVDREEGGILDFERDFRNPMRTRWEKPKWIFSLGGMAGFEERVPLTGLETRVGYAGQYMGLEASYQLTGMELDEEDINNNLKFIDYKWKDTWGPEGFDSADQARDWVRPLERAWLRLDTAEGSFEGRAGRLPVLMWEQGRLVDFFQPQTNHIVQDRKSFWADYKAPGFHGAYLGDDFLDQDFHLIYGSGQPAYGHSIFHDWVWESYYFFDADPLDFQDEAYWSDQSNTNQLLNGFGLHNRLPVWLGLTQSLFLETGGEGILRTDGEAGGRGEVGLSWERSWLKLGAGGLIFSGLIPNNGMLNPFFDLNRVRLATRDGDGTRLAAEGRLEFFYLENWHLKLAGRYYNENIDPFIGLSLSFGTPGKDQFYASLAFYRRNITEWGALFHSHSPNAVTRFQAVYFPMQSLEISLVFEVEPLPDYAEFTGEDARAISQIFTRYYFQ